MENCAVAAGGGRILRDVKERAGRSLYLYLEPRSTATLRTRLRFDRASLAASMFKRGMAYSLVCTLHASCARAGTEGSVLHSLLNCPALALQRQRCRNQLARLRPPALLTLPTLLGVVYADKEAKQQPPAAAAAAEADELHS